MRVRWLAVVGLALTMLLGCGGDKPVQIRIRNDTGRDISNFWLGSGTKSAYRSSFGSIAAGATTDYRSYVTTIAAYSKCDFVMADDNTRYLDTIEPEDHVGTPELAAGRYTFAYTIVNDEPALTIIRD